jgi:Mn-containing catalase
MFAHNKRLQYTVRVSESNPGLANLMLEQFGGPQGELPPRLPRYFTQAVSEDDPGRKDMLFDIATEELSHLEVIGHIVAMLNKGAKGDLAEAVDSEADMYRSITGAGNDSHVTQVLYGGGLRWSIRRACHGPRPTSTPSASRRPTCARTSRPRRAPRSSTSA